MAGLNKVMLIGRLGRDPEIRYSQQGLAVVNFSIATSEQWTDKNTGDRQEKTEWHRIVVFGKQAEICEKYLSKGSQIYVEGRLQTRNYEKDGQTHYITEIVVANFQFLGGKQDNQGGGGYQQGGGGGGFQKADSGPNNHSQGPTNPGMTGGQEPIPDDDIPF
ncbi:MAG: single-stranded DNA-binding protein [Desulfobacteraceae bacterium]|nr:single-stranded DNA-binding protein [Desulfobacteraceae bacterium]